MVSWMKPPSDGLVIKPCPECGFPAVFKGENFRCFHCGMTTRPAADKAEVDERLNERLYALNAEAMKLFCWTLAHQPKALKYAESRGLSKEACREYGIGASASKYGDTLLVRNLTKKGFTTDELLLVGLATKDETGAVVDRFVGRLMFPIINTAGKVCGFSGRTMTDAKAKYVNSPDSPVFHKGELLFMENRAFAGGKGIILCEGQMDAITQHIFGVKCAMASLGTALTPYNADRVRKTGKPIYICFDSDPAGIKASTKAIRLLGTKGVKVINLAPYKDPDELLRAIGLNGFSDRIRNATPADRFLVQHSANPISTAIELLEKEFYNKKEEN